MYISIFDSLPFSVFNVLKLTLEGQYVPYLPQLPSEHMT